MRKGIVFVALVLLALSLVSAYGYYDEDYYKEKITETKYYPHKSKVITTTTYINYDNDRRYSTYDYRHGYSYRTSAEYWDGYEDRYLKVVDYDYDYKKKDYDYRDYNYKKKYYDYGSYEGRKGYYFEYFPHLRRYKGKECYYTPPRDKLFYTPCP